MAPNQSKPHHPFLVATWARQKVLRHADLNKVGKEVRVNASVRFWMNVMTEHGEEEEQQWRFKGTFWLERLSLTEFFRLAFSGFLIVDSNPLGGLQNGDIQFPTLHALEPWLIQGKDDDISDTAIIRMRFPNTNNGMTKMQIVIPRSDGGALDAQILCDALVDANEARRVILAHGG